MAAIDIGTIDFIDLAGFSLEPDAVRRIPRALALRHDILSLASEGNQITIAVPDAADRDTIDRVRLVTGMHVRALRAPREAIRARLADLYPPDDALSRTSQHSGDDAPAIRALDEIHAAALADGASDIHVEPARTGGRVRHRVDGMLGEARSLGSELYAQVVSRIKLLAGMDIADKRQPQDGRYAIEYPDRSLDARVSSMPTIAGEKLCIRLLDRDARPATVEGLGMPGPIAQRFRRAIQSPHGFVVVCGPTGSGKTTTLYAALAERNVVWQNLCSVEDPVEVQVGGVAQVQVNPRAGVTFASALRAFLRQDPNVIMVGEMRDPETASVAASASLSGQLVLTTLHSNDAPKTIERLAELGVARHTIAAGLTAVLGQRLVRTLCRRCRIPDVLDQATARELSVPQSPVHRAGACAACRHTGYAGRTAIFELLWIDDRMRELIAGGASNVLIAKAARENGFEPMLVDGLRRVCAGETSLEEIRRVVHGEESL